MLTGAPLNAGLGLKFAEGTHRELPLSESSSFKTAAEMAGCIRAPRWNSAIWRTK